MIKNWIGSKNTDKSDLFADDTVLFKQNVLSSFEQNYLFFCPSKKFRKNMQQEEKVSHAVQLYIHSWIKP